MAVCTENWFAGDTYHSDIGEGYAIPNVFKGQRVIIAQVPACNPEARYNENIERIHKTNFVLVRFITDECGDFDPVTKQGCKYFVGERLFLVD